MQDVLYVYSGLTPAEPNASKGEVGRSKHAEIIDHAGRDGCEGLLSVIGVKFTTGRLVAERVVSLAQEKLGVTASANKARTLALPGAADYESGRGFPESALKNSITDLLEYHGGNLPAAPGQQAEEFREALSARVEHAVDREMALTLEDLMLRRTDLAARGKLTEPLVRLAAERMSRSLGWSSEATEASVNRVCAALRYLASSCPRGSQVERHGTRA